MLVLPLLLGAWVGWRCKDGWGSSRDRKFNADNSWKSLFSVAATGSADFLFPLAINLRNKTSDFWVISAPMRFMFQTSFLCDLAGASLESQQCCSKLRVVALGSEWAVFAVQATCTRSHGRVYLCIFAHDLSHFLPRKSPSASRSCCFTLFTHANIRLTLAIKMDFCVWGNMFPLLFYWVTARNIVVCTFVFILF